MSRGHDEPQRIAPQQPQRDAFGHALVVAHQADVEFAAAQALELQLRMHLAQVQRDVGVAAPVVGDDVAQHLGQRQRRRETDAQQADLAARHALQFLRQRLRRGEHRPRALEQGVASIGQRHRAARAREQLHAQLLFQRADLLAERWLRHVQAQRGPREVQLFRDGDEIAQVAQLH